MSYLTQKEVNQEFDEKFVRDDGLMNKYQNEGDIESIETTAESIKSHIAQIRQNDLKSNIEKLEGMKYKQESPNSDWWVVGGHRTTEFTANWHNEILSRVQIYYKELLSLNQ